jgi:hypothetical protein
MKMKDLDIEMHNTLDITNMTQKRLRTRFTRFYLDKRPLIRSRLKAPVQS